MNMNIIECVDDAKLFQPWFAGRSWNTWRVALKAAYALPMTKTERKVLRTIAGREPPKKPVRECWFVCGRRAGKELNRVIDRWVHGGVFRTERQAAAR